MKLVLEYSEGSGFGFRGEQFLECLLESFHFPARDWVVASGLFLDDPKLHQGAFDPVPSASASDESGGVDHGRSRVDHRFDAVNSWQLWFLTRGVFGEEWESR